MCYRISFNQLSMVIMYVYLHMVKQDQERLLRWSVIKNRTIQGLHHEHSKRFMNWSMKISMFCFVTLLKRVCLCPTPHCRKILQANLQTQAWKFASSCHVFVVAASETEDFSIFYVSWIFWTIQLLICDVKG